MISWRSKAAQSEFAANQRMKLTGAAILVLRGMKVLQAAPAAYPYRSAGKHMATTLKIIGVHPVEAEEPVHLIELLVEGDVGEFDIGEVTQEIKGKPKSEWQVAYDERLIEEWEEKTRYAFFFHYLDLKKPLLTSSG